MKILLDTDAGTTIWDYQPVQPTPAPAGSFDWAPVMAALQVATTPHDWVLDDWWRAVVVLLDAAEAAGQVLTPEMAACRNRLETWLAA